MHKYFQCAALASKYEYALYLFCINARERGMNYIVPQCGLASPCASYTSWKLWHDQCRAPHHQSPDGRTQAPEPAVYSPVDRSSRSTASGECHRERTRYARWHIIYVFIQTLRFAPSATHKIIYSIVVVHVRMNMNQEYSFRVGVPWNGAAGLERNHGSKLDEKLFGV